MTLVTGSSTSRQTLRDLQQPSAGGFSLLELLVVIIIIGLMYSVATIAFRSIERDPLDAELLRLQKVVQIAANESVIRSQPLAIGFFGRGYGIYVLDEPPEEEAPESDFAAAPTETAPPKPQWQSVELGWFLKDYQLPANLEQSLVLEGIEVVLSAEKPKKPQVFILPTGETSPFEYKLRNQRDASASAMQFNALGQRLSEDEANATNAL